MDKLSHIAQLLSSAAPFFDDSVQPELTILLKLLELLTSINKQRASGPSGQFRQPGRRSGTANSNMGGGGNQGGGTQGANMGGARNMNFNIGGGGNQGVGTQGARNMNFNIGGARNQLNFSDIIHDPDGMIDAIRPVCTAKESEYLNMYANIMRMKNLMEIMQLFSALMPDDAQQGNGDFLSKMMGAFGDADSLSKMMGAFGDADSLSKMMGAFGGADSLSKMMGAFGGADNKNEEVKNE